MRKEQMELQEIGRTSARQRAEKLWAAKDIHAASRGARDQNAAWRRCAHPSWGESSLEAPSPCCPPPSPWFLKTKKKIMVWPSRMCSEQYSSGTSTLADQLAKQTSRLRTLRLRRQRLHRNSTSHPNSGELKFKTTTAQILINIIHSSTNELMIRYQVSVVPRQDEQDEEKLMKNTVGLRTL